MRNRIRGTAALAAIGDDGRVAGLDVNESMFVIARDAAVGSAPPVTWHQGSPGDLPFGAGTFDVVLCQQGARFFADINAASSEIARVLRLAGRLLATAWAELSDSPYLAAQRRHHERHRRRTRRVLVVRSGPPDGSPPRSKRPG